MKIITAANERYYGAIAPYLVSLSRNSQIPVTLVCVTAGQMPVVPDGIGVVTLPRQMNGGAPNETECPQHGAWLKVVHGAADETCIFTDGDIIMQRPFTDSELDALQDLPEDTVMMGYNSGANETLAVEGARLFPRFSMEQIAAVFGDLSRPCYNIGVIAARRSTFERIYDAYMQAWQTVSDAFGHPARQQWLVVRSIHELGLNVQVTPYSFHANGHYGIPPGCGYRGGLLYSGDELVLFKHKL